MRTAAPGGTETISTGTPPESVMSTTLRLRARFTSRTIAMIAMPAPAKAPTHNARFQLSGGQAGCEEGCEGGRTGVLGVVGAPCGKGGGGAGAPGGSRSGDNGGGADADASGTDAALFNCLPRFTRCCLISAAANCTSKSPGYCFPISSSLKKIGLRSARLAIESICSSRLFSSSSGFGLSAPTMLSYTSAVTIALDATPLTVPTGGVTRYTLELAGALAERFPEDQYWLLSDQPFTMPESRSGNLHCGEGPRTFVARKWWLWGLEQEMTRRGVELFHGTDYSVPYLPRRPSVMTLHDLSPWLDPAWQPEAQRVRRRTPRLLRLGLATIVITCTEAVRRVAIERFRLAADRVVAVALAASKQFRPVAVPPPPVPY
ncbi:MAG: hypothetical protein DMG59_06545, partial [Acidobacteria bacterium]